VARARAPLARTFTNSESRQSNSVMTASSAIYGISGISVVGAASGAGACGAAVVAVVCSAGVFGCSVARSATRRLIPRGPW
jgi:hypothetical protein